MFRSPDAGTPPVPGIADFLLKPLGRERFPLAGMDIVPGNADARGFGLMADGSFPHWPVSENVLELYLTDESTYGGDVCRVQLRASRDAGRASSPRRSPTRVAARGSRLSI
jgi:hypothetical protein